MLLLFCQRLTRRSPSQTRRLRMGLLGAPATPLNPSSTSALHPCPSAVASPGGSHRTLFDPSRSTDQDLCYHPSWTLYIFSHHRHGIYFSSFFPPFLDLAEIL
ncbi:hypothetical protein VTJ04DRAFT_6011 [Mycothermus thermophilus]|uniref:uncharacterized protein n=1 Tax=Humicola insolens TaxID=85995 RepID=UPI003744554B